MGQEILATERFNAIYAKNAGAGFQRFNYLLRSASRDIQKYVFWVCWGSGLYGEKEMQTLYYCDFARALSALIYSYMIKKRKKVEVVLGSFS